MTLHSFEQVSDDPFRTRVPSGWLYSFQRERGAYFVPDPPDPVRITRQVIGTIAQVAENLLRNMEDINPTPPELHAQIVVFKHALDVLKALAN